MYQKLQFLCGRYYYLYLPAVVLALVVISHWLLGPPAWLLTSIIVAIAIGVLLYGFQQAIEELNRLNKVEAHLKAARELLAETRTVLGLSQTETGYWLNRYLDIRMDRSAVLKALTRVYPAGYREESQDMQTPFTRHEYENRNSNGVQTFFYLDYGHDEVHGQLRLRVNGVDKSFIGELPVYEGERLEIVEADSREMWRQYMSVVKLQDEALLPTSNSTP